jgi:outer membrane protein assembly factor BamB
MILLLLLLQDGQDWPQWRGVRRDGVWRESGLLERFEGVLPRRWSVPVGGGYSGPSVAAGRVYLMDRPKGKEVERVLCLDWKDGRTLWTLEYPCAYEGFSYAVGPRCTVTVHEGKAYALGAAGHLHCLDAASGEVLWKRDLRAEYRIRMPHWGISSHPLIEGDVLLTQIGGEGEACVIALDRLSGKERWKAFSDPAAYAPPLAITQAGRRVVLLPIGWRLVAFDPADGKLLWSHAQEVSSWTIAIPAPVPYQDLLLFSSAHAGSVLFRLSPDTPEASVVWERDRKKKNVDTLAPVIPDPLVMNGLAIGVQGDGELRCLDLLQGKRLWETKAPMPTGWHATMHLARAGDEGDRAWIFTETGHLILARLTAEGYGELARATLLEPTAEQGPRGRPVAWAHPAFAYRHVFARNDRELVCVDLSAR